ncbi:hypothetical protein T261_5355 [Streptomyces lydicus]|nr:hypothetical protein T261_5355 [Streptomyces lydicus]
MHCGRGTGGRNRPGAAPCQNGQSACGRVPAPPAQSEIHGPILGTAREPVPRPPGGTP